MNHSGTSLSIARTLTLRQFGLGIICVMAVLGLLFASSFDPAQLLFANDGPFGVAASAALALPAAFTGFWTDTSWLGQNGSMAPAGATYFILWLLGPVAYSKFYAPLTLLILGGSAWIFFRTLKLSPALCTVGALAAALNMNYFSNTCWGLGTRSLALAGVFLALAALSTRQVGNRWLNAALAGLALGWSVIEGADNGAIFSLYVAAFVVFQAWTQEPTWGRRLFSGSRVALVAVCAAFLAAQSLITLVNFGITSVSGMQQDTQTKEERWGWATQWSLPKIETLRVIIPGLYGYRMDTANGGQYWGGVGQDPRWTPEQPEFLARYSGAGEYAGVLVVLIAAWALAEACRKKGKTFSLEERRLIWFWAGAAVVSLLLAWGRHALFYQLIYALPYFSTIRNPLKFMHPFHLATLVLFAYGLLGLSRLYLQSAAGKLPGLMEGFTGWWRRKQGFEKKWAYACVGVVALSAVAFLAYGSDRQALVNHIMRIGYPDTTLAQQTAAYSMREVGLYVVFLVASVGALFLVMSGTLAGPRAKWAAVLLGGLITLDLARANLPWIVFYNYREKYASNPVIDILKDKPHTHRSIMPPFQGGREFAFLQQVFQIEWLQHHYPYYNIQSLNMPQEPRMPADKEAYLRALGGNVARYWQLANTRYVFGMAGGFVDALNDQLDKENKRFRLHTLFRLLPVADTPYFSAETNTTGPFALIEFTGALPRAKLYPAWEVSTNEQATLAKLADPTFDPAATVLVSDADVKPPPAAPPAGAPATVEFASYTPKEIVFRTDAPAPTVLLHNDRYDPAWKVWVDGKPARLLRCNFIMRGVEVPAGQHTVRLRFEPKLTGLKITLAAFGLGVVLCAALVVSVLRPPASPSDKEGASGRKS